MADTAFASAREEDNAEREKLVRVAWYYYRDEMTQAQIAERLHVSRPTVARLLERARLTGIVTIDINTTGVGGLELAKTLRTKYSLQDVVVVPQLDRQVSGEQTNTRIALAATQYIRRYLRPGAVVGVGWGDTVLRTLLALRRPSLTGVTFPTLTGGIDHYTARVNGAANNGISDFIKFIPAPLLASNPTIATALRQEKAVTNVLDLAKAADVTLIGIGGALTSATALQSGIITEDQVNDYRRKGAVGDILGEWYDERGRVLAIDMQKIRVGIELRELRSMRNVMAVAGGIDKVAAIKGALAGGYIDILVTTEDVARELNEA